MSKMRDKLIQNIGNHLELNPPITEVTGANKQTVATKRGPERAQSLTNKAVATICGPENTVAMVGSNKDPSCSRQTK